jgi:hypothetical protein
MSVEKSASMQSQMSVGIHARSFRQGAVGVSITCDDKILPAYSSL